MEKQKIAWKTIFKFLFPDCSATYEIFLWLKQINLVSKSSEEGEERPILTTLSQVGWLLLLNMKVITFFYIYINLNCICFSYHGKM